jgi:hypothetical protein
MYPQEYSPWQMFGRKGCTFKPSLSRKLLNSTIEDGFTGNLKFNELGERMYNKYKIINVQQSGLMEVGRYKNGQLQINETVTWLGGSTDVPKGTYLSNHLRVRIANHATPNII